MNAEETFDVVIVGAGHNGTTLGAYLAKCGLSVCLLEDRPEGGGGQENTEIFAGVRASVHAVGQVSAPAPAWEQLELVKYGYRHQWPATSTIRGKIPPLILTTEGWIRTTEKDNQAWMKLSGMAAEQPFIKDLLRAVYWCPPHPPEVEVTADNMPFMQVYKQHAPDIWTPELLEMTMFDFLDEYIESEPVKVFAANLAGLTVSHGHFEGMAIPAFASVVMDTYHDRGIGPHGNMHGFYHAIYRCAIAHGAIMRTCCPVEEIIISNGRAVGVRLRDDAAWGEKRIWAKKAVISAIDTKQTFLNLIGPSHLDASLIQKIKDLSVLGGGLVHAQFLCKERFRFQERFREGWGKLDAFYGAMYPCDSREIYFDNIADQFGRIGKPTVPPERLLWLMNGSGLFNPIVDRQCNRPGLIVEGPFDCVVPYPEEHMRIPGQGMEEIREWVHDYIIEALSQVVENANADNIVARWSGNPYDSEWRNAGLTGGSWYGITPTRDQWFNKRPIPELARYKTPIEGLYLCNQFSAHPGGMCLMAIPYNLMHILIEDGVAEPGDWWFASPWYIPREGKISATGR